MSEDYKKGVIQNKIDLSPERLQRLKDRLSCVDEGFEILSFLEVQNVPLLFDAQMESAASIRINRQHCYEMSGLIIFDGMQLVLNPHFSDDELISTIAHEARHVQQYAAGLGMPPHAVTPEDLRWFVRCQEADAESFAAEIVCKMALNGDDGPYQARQQDCPSGPFVAYETCFKNNIFAMETGEATRAAFDAWFEVAEHLKLYDTHTDQETMPYFLSILGQFNRDMAIHPLSVKTVEQFQELSETNYLSLPGLKTLDHERYKSHSKEKEARVSSDQLNYFIENRPTSGM